MLRRTLGLALSVALCSSAIAADSAQWQADRYNIVVRDQALRDVLMQFGSLAGVPVVVSSEVDGSVSARFEGASGSEIIAALAREYALDWRYDGRRIEVSSNSEQVSRILDMGGVKRSSLVGALESLGAYESRFPITATDEQLALVVGPPRYVGIVEIVLTELVEKRLADKAERAEREREARILEKEERERALEALRIQAELAERLRRASMLKSSPERTAPIVNRGGRWGG